MILYELISLDVLRLIWWVLLGVLLIGFAMTDGFDLGTATLLPFVGKTNNERRVIINTIAPVWEGNQVWLILGAGAIFAAWPTLYAVSFSGFYLVMFTILMSLILRPVGFAYRSKRDSVVWRTAWDWALFVGGTVPAFIFGVAIGNTLLGVPFNLTPDLFSHYEGSYFGKFIQLLRPFALLTGFVSLTMLITHGAAWLVLKTEGLIAARARNIGTITGILTIIGYAAAGLWLAYGGIEGYAFVNPPVANGPSNPLYSEVARTSSWFLVYNDRPWIMIAPVLGFVGMIMTIRGMYRSEEIAPLLWSKLNILGIISSVGLTMFPFLLPSSINPTASLTVWDSSSSQQTLFTILVAAAIFMPMILVYTSWVYKVFWGKVTENDVVEKSETLY